MAVFLILGGILSAIGTGLLVARKKNQDKLLEIRATQTSTAKELHELSRSVEDELGTKGGFAQLAEVKGTVTCAIPLAGELSGQKCVYYAMSVEERYEEMETYTDAKGNTAQRTKTSTTTVASNTQRVEFEIDDGTGLLKVQPAGADIEGIKVMDQYKPSAGGSFSFGAFNFKSTGGRKILGYQLTETVLPLGRRVYILGEATDRSGELTIGVPGEKGKPFIITLKSEEELTRATASMVRGFSIGAIVCFALSVATLIAAFLQP